MLQRYSIVTFFDKAVNLDQRTRDSKKESALMSSKCIALFLNESYKDKVNGSNSSDTCVREWKHVRSLIEKGAKLILVAVNQAGTTSLTSPSEWTGPLQVLQTHSPHLCLEAPEDFVGSQFESWCEELAKHIKAITDEEE